VHVRPFPDRGIRPRGKRGLGSRKGGVVQTGAPRRSRRGRSPGDWFR
jgi:hypothetical protein